MINYTTPAAPEILTTYVEIPDDSVFTSGGSVALLSDALWLFTYMQIDNFLTINFTIPNNPDFYFDIGSTTGSIAPIPQFSSNASNPVFIIYPNQLISNGIDMGANGILNFGWLGSASYVPIGTVIKLKSYYITQPTL
jgi:hypothetical protein